MSEHPRTYRTGLGYDIHQLVPGKRLVLGGVEVPSDIGFDTHSDGDVLSHALVDALAGAIADGDLGTHFPEDDPDAQDARSLDFVAQFAERVAQAGHAIENVDSFVVLGTVRLRPHIDQMRANIANALDVELTRVSVKARSNDGIGAEGQGAACSAWVSVLVSSRGE
jgi:2-C-methyl-D-erythritol 2,4-cyclodiphosphate synthase